MDNESLDSKHSSDDFYAVYSDYSKILRAWFVAYGIGGPVLFLTQDKIADLLIRSGKSDFVVYSFLVGVALQVIIALVNKWVNWYLYFTHINLEKYEHKWTYKIIDWISERFWIDVIADLGSIVAFGLATVKALLICTGTNGEGT